MSGHTPTPWRACDSHPQRACIYIKPEDGWREIAILYGGFDDHEVKDENGVWQNDTIRMANAAFICKAVNSHDALVTELKLIADWRNVSLAGEYEHSLRDIIRSMLDCADRAIASIKDKSQ